VAREADLHPIYIGQVERGEESIEVENLVRMGRALGFGANRTLRGIV